MARKLFKRDSTKRCWRCSWRWPTTAGSASVQFRRPQAARHFGKRQRCVPRASPQARTPLLRGTPTSSGVAPPPRASQIGTLSLTSGNSCVGSPKKNEAPAARSDGAAVGCLTAFPEAVPPAATTAAEARSLVLAMPSTLGGGAAVSENSDDETAISLAGSFRATTKSYCYLPLHSHRVVDGSGTSNGDVLCPRRTQPASSRQAERYPLMFWLWPPPGRRCLPGPAACRYPGRSTTARRALPGR